jgi:hypothetical protein
MPITGLTLITVTAKYLKLDGTAASGKVTFQASTVLKNTSANEIIYPVDFTVTLNGSGVLSVVLPSTDDPDIDPQGWFYTVTEDITGSDVSLTYTISLPFDLAGSTVDLADIVHEDPPPSESIFAETYLVLE